MDNIFTLIIVIAAIIAVVGKLTAKQKTTSDGKPPKAAGWITKLNTFIEDIQKSVEQSGREGGSGASQWGRLLEGGQAQSSPYDRYEDEDENIDLDLLETPDPPKRKPAVQPVRAQAKPPDKKVIAPPQALAAQKKTRTRLPSDRHGLRTAVIWSEIIGPPIALRKDGHR